MKALLVLLSLTTTPRIHAQDPRPSEAATAPVHFVAVDGRTENAGTAGSPWDIASALSGQKTIAPGATVYLKGGTYRHPDRRWASPGLAIGLEGEPERPIHIRPVQGERVTLDGKVEVKPNARGLWLWDVEITVSETTTWNRRVTAGGAAVDGTADLPQGGLNILGGSGSKFINLVIHDMYSGVGLWRPATDVEMHGCLVYGIGAVGPDRWHGPGIYTQNETGVKRLTNNILFGNYSTTIQAYGSSRAPVRGFRIEGNIAFAPMKEGQRERFLIGGGQPAANIVANGNVLYEVPLQLGYGTVENEDATVRDNWIVNAGIGIHRFRKVDQGGNFELAAQAPRPGRPVDVVIRPNAYTPGRSHLAIFNWERNAEVSVDLGSVLKPGQSFRLLNALDFFGAPVASGTFGGKPVSVPIPDEARTGQGEFCAFVILAGAGSESPSTAK